MALSEQSGFQKWGLELNDMDGHSRALGIISNPTLGCSEQGQQKES